MTELDELDTPALLVDVDRLERNIGRMAEKAARAGVGLRPHFKTSKLLKVVECQLKHGAMGITCATDIELLALQDLGVERILWGHQPVGPAKVELAVHANRRGQVIVAVDSVEVARAVGERAAQDEMSIPCVIEVDTGMHRCGVKPTDAPALAQALQDVEGVTVVGLMTHEGHLHHHLDDPAGLIASAQAAADDLVGASAQVAAAGIDASVVSVGSTPAASMAPFFEGVTEVRPGTYVFYDANQVELGSATWEDCAVTVLTRVVSRTGAGTAVVDAGLKALSGDHSIRGFGYGRVVELGATLLYAYEEHGALAHGDVGRLRVGDLVRIVPNHACGAVNMWSRVYAVRDGAVVGEWSTSGRR